MAKKSLYLILLISFLLVTSANAGDMYDYHQDKRKEAERYNANKPPSNRFTKDLKAALDEVDREFPVNALRDCIIFATSFLPKEQAGDKNVDNITLFPAKKDTDKKK